MAPLRTAQLNLPPPFLSIGSDQEPDWAIYRTPVAMATSGTERGSLTLMAQAEARAQPACRVLPSAFCAAQTWQEVPGSLFSMHQKDTPPNTPQPCSPPPPGAAPTPPASEMLARLGTNLEWSPWRSSCWGLGGFPLP